MPPVDVLPDAPRTSKQERSLASGILFATSGTGDSDAAARVASAFASRHQVPMAAVGVLPPVSPEFLAYQGQYREIDVKRGERLSRSIADQLARIGANVRDVTIDIGDIAQVVANEASIRGAAIVALGLLPHGAVDRLLGVEVAVRVLRRGTVPVLAIPPSAIGSMSRIVIAVDFGATDERVAALAMALASDDAVLHIVHACAHDEYAPGWDRRQLVYEAGANALLERFVAKLSLPSRLRVERHVVCGDPAHVIREIATQEGADLIALGTHRWGFAARVIFGSVADSLLRHADCSVLVVPEDVNDHGG